MASNQQPYKLDRKKIRSCLDNGDWDIWKWLLSGRRARLVTELQNYQKQNQSGTVSIKGFNEYLKKKWILPLMTNRAEDCVTNQLQNFQRRKQTQPSPTGSTASSWRQHGSTSSSGSHGSTSWQNPQQLHRYIPTPSINPQQHKFKQKLNSAIDTNLKSKLTPDQIKRLKKDEVNDLELIEETAKALSKLSKDKKLDENSIGLFRRMMIDLLSKHPEFSSNMHVINFVKGFKALHQLLQKNPSILCDLQGMHIDSDFKDQMTIDQLFAIIQKIPEGKIESCRKNIADAIAYTAGLELSRQSFDFMSRHNMIGDWIRALYMTYEKDNVDQFFTDYLPPQWIQVMRPELNKYYQQQIRKQQQQQRQPVQAMKGSSIEARNSTKQKQQRAAPTAAGGNSKVCALFLDNEEYNFRGCNRVPNLECLLIPNNSEGVKRTGQRDSDLYDSLVQKDEFIGEDEHRESLHDKKFFKFSKSEIGPGIEEQHLDTIRQWTADHKDSCSKMLLFFDWDRTLSRCEGCDMSPFTAAFYKNFAHVYMSFLMGGKTRWGLLMKLINELRQMYGAKLEYYVITNNDYCTDKYDERAEQAAHFSSFLTMVRMLFGQDFPEEHLICMPVEIRKKRATYSSLIAPKVQTIQQIMSRH